MEPLKEMFNRNFYERLADALHQAHNNIHPGKFIKDAVKNLDDMSLNQRLRNTSIIMKKHFPDDFLKSVSIMEKTITMLPKGYTTLIFPDFVALYGLDNYDASLDALAFFTSFGSSEFAIREFLKRDFSRTIKVMETWAKDKNHHVRRLASEGSRPRLPWSFKLDEVIQNPRLTRNIIEQLKTDETLYVRKSVANHLNDFSKDHPAYMLKVLGNWDGANPDTAWIMKHACRTLIKKGDKDALKLFSFEQNVKAVLANLALSRKTLKLGDTLEFHFDICSTSKAPQKLVIDYRVHYSRKTESSSKVFKLKEVVLDPGSRISFSKRQVFRDFSTRKHYPGTHTVEILVNGQVLGREEFELTVV